MTKLTDVVGIGPVTAKILADHHIKTPEALAAISIAALEEVPGFSNLRAKTVKKAAAAYLLKNTNKQTVAKESTGQNTTITLSADSVHTDTTKPKNKIKKDKKKEAPKKKVKEKIKKKEDKKKTKIKKEKKKNKKKKI